MATDKAFKQLDRQMAIVNRINILYPNSRSLRRRKSAALAIINQLVSSMQDKQVK